MPKSLSAVRFLNFSVYEEVYERFRQYGQVPHSAFLISLSSLESPVHQKTRVPNSFLQLAITIFEFFSMRFFPPPYASTATCSKLFGFTNMKPTCYWQVTIFCVHCWHIQRWNFTMSGIRAKDKSKTSRQRAGHAIAEFGPALFLLIAMLVPLFNLSTIITRYMIAQGTIDEAVHRLAKSESRLQISSGQWYSDFAQKCGVEFGNIQLTLDIVSLTNNQKISVASHQKIPDNWLPGGTYAPCSYMLKLNADTYVQPLFNGSPVDLPGIFSPVAFHCQSYSIWENLGKDPVSKEFFINQ